MQKKPLSHAQMAFAIAVAIAVAGPGFYLAAFNGSPWLALATCALLTVWQSRKKRGSAAN